MSLREASFRCPDGHEMRDVMLTLPPGGSLREVEIPCIECGQPTVHFWPMGTRFAMVSDEKPPLDVVRSAREAFVQKAPWERVTPFMGETRTDLKRWMSANNIAYVSTGDERQRGKTHVTEKKRFADSPEFERIQDDAIRKRAQMHPDSDAYKETFGSIERPNEYDVSTFKEQVSLDENLAASDQPTAVTDIAAELKVTE